MPPVAFTKHGSCWGSLELVLSQALTTADRLFLGGPQSPLPHRVQGEAAVAQ